MSRKSPSTTASPGRGPGATSILRRRRMLPGGNGGATCQPSGSLSSSSLGAFGPRPRRADGSSRLATSSPPPATQPAQTLTGGILTSVNGTPAVRTIIELEISMTTGTSSRSSPSRVPPAVSSGTARSSAVRKPDPARAPSSASLPATAGSQSIEVTVRSPK